MSDVAKVVDGLFQSTLPARGATGSVKSGACRGGISIHAPREGSDKWRTSFGMTQDISIHAPREGSDFFSAVTMVSLLVFQSTLPARGATGIAAVLLFGGRHFNPRSPRGERPKVVVTASRSRIFQSTLPARGATADVHKYTSAGL